MPSGQIQPSLATRLLWFLALWLAGVGAVAAIAFILRLWIRVA